MYSSIHCACTYNSINRVSPFTTTIYVPNRYKQVYHWTLTLMCLLVGVPIIECIKCRSTVLTVDHITINVFKWEWALFCPDFKQFLELCVAVDRVVCVPDGLIVVLGVVSLSDEGVDDVVVEINIAVEPKH